LAHLKALESLPSVMDPLGVDGGSRVSLQGELIHKIGEDSEVTTGLRSNPGVMPSQKAGHPTAILRWAGSIPIQANGIATPRVSLMLALEA
jgi:hypothetical protein